MTTKTTLLSFSMIALLALTACGPSTAEINKKQQATLDSIKQASIDSTKKATENEIAQKIENELAAKEAEKKRKELEEIRKNDAITLKRYISDLETELEIQYTKYEDLKSPKFLRTPTEKEAQLRYQLNTIKDLEQNIYDAREQLSLLEKGKKYNMAVDFVSIQDSTSY